MSINAKDWFAYANSLAKDLDVSQDVALKLCLLEALSDLDISKSLGNIDTQLDCINRNIRNLG